MIVCVRGFDTSAGYHWDTVAGNWSDSEDDSTCPKHIECKHILIDRDIWIKLEGMITFEADYKTYARELSDLLEKVLGE